MKRGLPKKGRTWPKAGVGCSGDRMVPGGSWRRRGGSSMGCPHISEKVSGGIVELRCRGRRGLSVGQPWRKHWHPVHNWSGSWKAPHPPAGIAQRGNPLGSMIPSLAQGLMACMQMGAHTRMHHTRAHMHAHTHSHRYLISPPKALQPPNSACPGPQSHLCISLSPQSHYRKL